ncbi:MAG TPA: fatty acid desaturase [Myxococcaceae bacterium]|nr:fatty acid desaturase [Myxococcaceae bacterium]
MALGIPHHRSWPMYLCHAVGIAGPFFVPFRWGFVALAAALYLARMLALSGGFHRYFAHRSYRTGRGFQFVLAFLGGTCAQRGVLWWAGNHRHHHRHSDAPEDLHSPRQHGFFWSHVGWILSKRHAETRNDLIRDFARFPELRWLDRHHFVPPLVMLGVLLLAGGVPAAIWGAFTSSVLLWHLTFTINSLAHTVGSTRYPTGDDSRNNPLLALLTLGEGWHNNHHHYPASSTFGFFWWEVDLTYWVLRALEAAGLIWDVREIPAELRDGRPRTARPDVEVGR